MTMSPTRRLNRKRGKASVTSLADLLPEELRGFQVDTDMPARTSEIAAWLDTQVPGQSQHLLGPVMDASGLTVLSALRDRLMQRQGE